MLGVPAPALTDGGPRVELVEDRRDLGRAARQPARHALQQRGPVLGVGLLHALDPADRHPQLLHRRARQQDHRGADRLHGREEVAQRAQVLPGLVGGEGGPEALPDQRRAAPLLGDVLAQPARGDDPVQLRQRRALQRGEVVGRLGREAGQAVGQRVGAELGGQPGVQHGAGADVVVGHPAHGARVVAGRRRGGVGGGRGVVGSGHGRPCKHGPGPGALLAERVLGVVPAGARRAGGPGGRRRRRPRRAPPRPRRGPRCPRTGRAAAPTLAVTRPRGVPGAGTSTQAVTRAATREISRSCTSSQSTRKASSPTRARVSPRRRLRRSRDETSTSTESPGGPAVLGDEVVQAVQRHPDHADRAAGAGRALEGVDGAVHGEGDGAAGRSARPRPPASGAGAGSGRASPSRCRTSATSSEAAVRTAAADRRTATGAPSPPAYGPGRARPRGARGPAPAGRRGPPRGRDRRAGRRGGGGPGHPGRDRARAGRRR